MWKSINLKFFCCCFRTDINEGKLGSKPARELLDELKPKYWFAAHLHCKFAAIVNHESDGNVNNLLVI